MPLRWAFVALVTTLAVGCAEKSNQYVPPPPPKVTVSHAVEKEVRDFWQFTGNVEAIENVEVRARVQGFIDQVNFKPDMIVPQGTLLYTIDPRQFQASVEQMKAEVESKQAALDLAKVNYDRIQGLYQKQAASDLELRQNKATYDGAVADLALAKAQLDTAKLNLDWSQVRAPITGRISRNLVDVGALVGASEPTLLATIRNDAQVYVYFNASEADLLEYLRMHPTARTKSAAERDADTVVYMALSDEQGFPHEGHMESADNHVDPETGTLLLRAVFPNPEHRIVPGMFARVRVPRTRGKSMLVPDMAVGFDQRGSYVLVVDDKNKVERRDVTTGEPIGEFRRVESGLNTDDWVVVDGLQRARPGIEVTPEKKSLDVKLPDLLTAPLPGSDTTSPAPAGSSSDKAPSAEPKQPAADKPADASADKPAAKSAPASDASPAKP